MEAVEIAALLEEDDDNDDEEIEDDGKIGVVVRDPM